MLIGTNDATASDTSGVPAYVNNLEASATWLTVPSTTKVSASSCTQSGPWGTRWTNPNVNAMPAGTMVNQSSGSTLTCPITVINGSVYMWYTGGVATISIDGGPPIGNGLGSNSYYRYVVRATGIAPARTTSRSRSMLRASAAMRPTSSGLARQDREIAVGSPSVACCDSRATIMGR